jgi:hypothetical protein
MTDYQICGQYAKEESELDHGVRLLMAAYP